jgi:hypothetical protein
MPALDNKAIAHLTFLSDYKLIQANNASFQNEE